MEEYLEILEKILTKGEKKENRTGIDTIAIAGAEFEHDMSEGFPLLTTRKLYTRGMLAETEFFIKGVTDKNWLRNKGVNIWDDWCNNHELFYRYNLESKETIARDFLKIYSEFKDSVPKERVHERFQKLVEKADSYFIKNDKGQLQTNIKNSDLEDLVLKYDENLNITQLGFVATFGKYALRDLGPIYGFQWRHFGAKYETFDKDYSGEGIDQLKNIVDKLKTSPNDRRMIVSAWNPVDIDSGKMALPPCHYAFQVTVINGKLNLIWEQRSVDTPLGLPFNIAGYGTILHLLAKESGFKEGKLIGQLGDVHLYVNQVEKVKEQLSRKPGKLPTIKTDNFTNIFDWKYTDSKFENYNPQERIIFPPVAV